MHSIDKKREEPDPQLFPALRSKMADWWYYTTSMTFSDVSKWIRRADEIHERKELRTWIQREIQDDRLQQIASYLRDQKQHFFNAIVVGIYDGNPDWLPIEVGKNVSRPELLLSDREGNSFGLLHLTGKEQIFAIDGQHRVEGIKKAIEQEPNLTEEEITVIFVGHGKDPAGHQRTRRLFFTLNRYAKPVSKSDLIALSEDDAYAVATRKLVDEHAGLDEKRVIKAPDANIPTGDNTSFTTLVALYNTTVILGKPRKREEKRRFKDGPITEADVEQVLSKSKVFWTTVAKKVPPIRRVFKAKEPGIVVKEFRNSAGGNLLFRPLGLKCFTEATRTLIDRGAALDKAISKLAKANLELSESPWNNGVLWSQHTGRMAESKHAKLATNMLLHVVGEKSKSKNYKLLEEYRKALANPNADLPESK